MDHAVDIAILARAPIPGTAKTRLIPAIGAHGASRLHRAMVLRTLQTACQARLGGNIVLWGTPTVRHRFFRSLEKLGHTCKKQPTGDLGDRMRAALRAGFPHPTLLVGTDCPCLTPTHLRTAANVLIEGRDAVFLPTEDGGYGLIGLRSPAHPWLFDGIPWGTDKVMAETRLRLKAIHYAWTEPTTIWDVDNPVDLLRLQEWATHSNFHRENQDAGNYWRDWGLFP